MIFGAYGIMQSYRSSSILREFCRLVMAMFLYIQMIYGTWPYFAKLQVKFKFEGVSSIFQGVMALFGLKINNNISFRTFSWP